MAFGRRYQIGRFRHVGPIASRGLCPRFLAGYGSLRWERNFRVRFKFSSLLILSITRANHMYVPIFCVILRGEGARDYPWILNCPQVPGLITTCRVVITLVPQMKLRLDYDVGVACLVKAVLLTRSLHRHGAV